MRSPTIYESSSPITKGSKGRMAKMRHFITAPLRRYTSTPQSSQCGANLSEQIRSLIQDGAAYIGRPLEELKHAQVPPFLQSLCSHILSVGVHIETLILEDWSQKRIRAIIFDGMTLSTLLQECPNEVKQESYVATNIFRLYMARIPDPLVDRHLVASFFETRKDLLYSSYPMELDSDDLAYVSDLLLEKLSCFEFKILDYIVSFMCELRKNCDARYATDLGLYLGRELCRLDEDNTELGRIGEIFIENYEGIFQREPPDDDSSSDSSSRTTDAYTPDERSQDETSSTSDTDDFRSTPVSPLKEFPERSSREVLDFDAKQYRKNSSIRSITELLSAPDDTSRDEGVRSTTYQDYNSQEESSAISDDYSSDESEFARDADGSDPDDDSCPHELRRSSERAFPGMHKSSNTKERPRRKSKRRHSKEDLMTRVQSSEDDEKSQSSQDERDQSQGSQLFRDLFSSNEPATVDRASYGFNMSHTENFHRTAPRFSRYDEDEEEKEKKGFFDSEPHRINHTMKSLTKSISSLKKKIKRLDEEYELSSGRRLSGRGHHGESKKLNAELNRLRKELKQMKSDASSMIQKPFSRLEPQPIFKPDTIYTIRHVEETLLTKRNDANRPCELNQMTQDQIQVEKTELQRALLYYESIHGRPTTKEDRDLARPLYDRYRQVKRTIVRTSSRTKETMVELPPIIEHVAMDFTLASPQHRGSLQGEDGIREHQEILLNASINPDPHPELNPTPAPPVRPTVNIGDLHALPIEELKERKKEARDDKRRLRKCLRDFEEKFESETGRKVQKEDRGSMEHSYSEYKHAKAKLRLLEALISKHESLN